ncbi:hypothetical protein RF11_00803 [Thelohanellus kitauei]|uniref:Uncharacterized protein n=1 Tax=Thelohanellus kitauei TaxID=669202 RepID=A0A0C2MW23_THEKT|nr:hypothetical protein RF11_00803 [Thelohanellus kitauei]
MPFLRNIVRRTFLQANPHSAVANQCRYWILSNSRKRFKSINIAADLGKASKSYVRWTVPNWKYYIRYDHINNIFIEINPLFINMLIFTYWGISTAKHKSLRIKDFYV